MIFRPIPLASGAVRRGSRRSRSDTLRYRQSSGDEGSLVVDPCRTRHGARRVNQGIFPCLRLGTRRPDCGRAILSRSRATCPMFVAFSRAVRTAACPMAPLHRTTSTPLTATNHALPREDTPGFSDNGALQRFPPFEMDHFVIQRSTESAVDSLLAHVLDRRTGPTSPGHALGPAILPDGGAPSSPWPARGAF